MSRTPIIGAVLVGILGAGGAAGAFAAGDAPPHHGGKQVLTLTARAVQETDLDLGEEGFSQGDRFVFFEELFDGGTRVGEDGGECVAVRVQKQAATFDCAASVRLPRGQLTVQGLVTFPAEGEEEPFTVAITGGTGRYKTAHGELTITPGEEADTFRFTIIP